NRALGRREGGPAIHRWRGLPHGTGGHLRERGLPEHPDPVVDLVVAAGIDVVPVERQLDDPVEEVLAQRTVGLALPLRAAGILLKARDPARGALEEAGEGGSVAVEVQA